MVHIAGTFYSKTHKGITASIDDGYYDFLTLRSLFFCFVKSGMKQEQVDKMNKSFNDQLDKYDWFVEGFYTIVIDMKTYQINLLQNPKETSEFLPELNEDERRN